MPNKTELMNQVLQKFAELNTDANGNLLTQYLKDMQSSALSNQHKILINKRAREILAFFKEGIALDRDIDYYQNKLHFLNQVAKLFERWPEYLAKPKTILANSLVWQQDYEVAAAYLDKSNTSNEQVTDENIQLFFLKKSTEQQFAQLNNDETTQLINWQLAFIHSKDYKDQDQKDKDVAKLVNFKKIFLNGFQQNQSSRYYTILSKLLTILKKVIEEASRNKRNFEQKLSETFTNLNKPENILFLSSYRDKLMQSSDPTNANQINTINKCLDLFKTGSIPPDRINHYYLEIHRDLVTIRNIIAQQKPMTITPQSPSSSKTLSQNADPSGPLMQRDRKHARDQSVSNKTKKEDEQPRKSPKLS